MIANRHFSRKLIPSDGSRTERGARSATTVTSKYGKASRFALVRAADVRAIRFDLICGRPSHLRMQYSFLAPRTNNELPATAGVDQNRSSSIWFVAMTFISGPVCRPHDDHRTERPADNGAPVYKEATGTNGYRKSRGFNKNESKLRSVGQ